jgi:hypothetical protein
MQQDVSDNNWKCFVYGLWQSMPPLSTLTTSPIYDPKLVLELRTFLDPPVKLSSNLSPAKPSLGFNAQLNALQGLMYSLASFFSNQPSNEKVVPAHSNVRIQLFDERRLFSYGLSNWTTVIIKRDEIAPRVILSEDEKFSLRLCEIVYDAVEEKMSLQGELLHTDELTFKLEVAFSSSLVIGSSELKLFENLGVTIGVYSISLLNQDWVQLDLLFSDISN